MNDQDVRIQTTDLDAALAYRIHRAARVLRIHLGRLIASYGENMSAEQFFVFFRAHAGNGCRQGELADPKLEDYSNVTRLVDSLVRKGLLERRPDPGDRRSHLIFLTERGHELAERLIPAVMAERRYVYGDLTVDVLAGFLETVEAIETNARSRIRDIEEDSGADKPRDT